MPDPTSYTPGFDFTAVDVASGSDFYEFFVQGDGAGNKTVSGAPANTWFEGSAL